MINIMLSGCGGNMGRAISRVAKLDDNLKIACGIDINASSLSCEYPVFASSTNCDVKCDVIIDFSHPDALNELVRHAVSTKTPIVVATTGLSQNQIAMLKQASIDVAVFHSANMSLGVNLIIELATKAATILEQDFDIEIIEKHHNQKIDAPSGTALAIADAISATLGDNKKYMYDRHSQRKKRDKSEIGIHAVRGGTIVGDHTILFAGNDEMIEIRHTATSKEVFAVGALSAARYIVGKLSGMYSMKDIVSDIT